MKRKTLLAAAGTVCGLLLLLTAAGPATADGYPALEEIGTLKIVYDFRVRSPEAAERVLALISDTYADRFIKKAAGTPEIVVVFLGPAVRLVSMNREDFSAKDQKILGRIERAVTKMTKAGIRFEACLYAARRFEVDPAKIFREIRRVENGWISLAAYQTGGFALVTAY